MKLNKIKKKLVNKSNQFILKLNHYIVNKNIIFLKLLVMVKLIISLIMKE